MSEKMDGVRAYWSGSKMISRHGTIINCPSWFTTSLTKQTALDGELWGGQGTTVENVMKVLTSKNGNWSKIGYYVFDLPSSPGSYEERMEHMEDINSVLPHHVRIVENIQCTGTLHLYQY